MNRRKFRIDKIDGKLLGVCAGIARLTGVDATIVRIALVVLTLAGGFPWTLVAYGALAWIGKAAAADENRLSVRDLNRVMTTSDRRLAEIETYVASPNQRLAREIDALR